MICVNLCLLFQECSTHPNYTNNTETHFTVIKLFIQSGCYLLRTCTSWFKNILFHIHVLIHTLPLVLFSKVIAILLKRHLKLVECISSYLYAISVFYVHFSYNSLLWKNEHIQTLRKIHSLLKVAKMTSLKQSQYQCENVEPCTQ